MARRHPEFGVVDVGRDDLLEASLSVFTSNELHELVVDHGAFGIEEAASWTELMEEEEVLLLTDLSVVTLGSLLLEVLPLLQLLGIWERDTVDSLQALAVRVALPVRRGVLGQSESLDLSRMTDVGSTAQINEWATSVDSRRWRVDLLVQDSLLELVILERKLINSAIRA